MTGHTNGCRWEHGQQQPERFMDGGAAGTATTFYNAYLSTTTCFTHFPAFKRTWRVGDTRFDGASLRGGRGQLAAGASGRLFNTGALLAFSTYLYCPSHLTTRSGFAGAFLRFAHYAWHAAACFRLDMAFLHSYIPHMMIDARTNAGGTCRSAPLPL